jgi:hypothetical protein
MSACCYVCQEEEDANVPFCEVGICDCKGNNRIHTCCFQKLRNQDVCSICKKPFVNVEHLIINDVLHLEKVVEVDPFGWKHEYTIDQRGRKQGIHRIYYTTGVLWEETQYKNDMKNGYQKVWNYHGKLFVNDKFQLGVKLED